MSDTQLIYDELCKLVGLDDKFAGIQTAFANSGMTVWAPVRGNQISALQMVMLTQLDPYYCAALVGPEQWNQFIGTLNTMIQAYNRSLQTSRTSRRITDNIIGL